MKKVLLRWSVAASVVSTLNCSASESFQGDGIKSSRSQTSSDGTALPSNHHSTQQDESPGADSASTSPIDIDSGSGVEGKSKNEDEQSDQDDVVPPSPIAGSFLVCQSEGKIQDEYMIGCGIMNDENVPVSLPDGSSVLVNVRLQNQKIHQEKIVGPYESQWPLRFRMSGEPGVIYNISADIYYPGDQEPLSVETQIELENLDDEVPSSTEEDDDIEDENMEPQSFVLASSIGMGDSEFLQANPGTCPEKIATAGSRNVANLEKTIILTSVKSLEIGFRGVCGVETNSYIRLETSSGEIIASRTLGNDDFTFLFGELPMGEYVVRVVTVIVPGFSDLDDFFIEAIDVTIY